MGMLGNLTRGLLSLLYCSCVVPIEGITLALVTTTRVEGDVIRKVI